MEMANQARILLASESETSNVICEGKKMEGIRISEKERRF